MKAFVIHTRQVPGCACKAEQSPLFLVEVEGEMVSTLEDASVGWLPKGEFRFRITKPVFLHEAKEGKKEDGSKEKLLIPSVYHSHSIYLTEEEAWAAAKRLVISEFEFAFRKKKIDAYSEADIEKRIAEIQRIPL